MAIHHIIYVPGLSDHRPSGQNILIQFWRLFGFTPHYFPLGWATNESFKSKLNRLLAEIDSLAEAGDKVSLAGVSAGASAVLAAYTNRPGLNGIICICGKIQRPNTISAATFADNPGFKESMRQVTSNLGQLQQKGLCKNIMSIHPLRDTRVSPDDTRITGAREKTIPVWGHAAGILAGILIGAPSIAKFLRSK